MPELSLKSELICETNILAPVIDSFAVLPTSDLGVGGTFKNDFIMWALVDRCFVSIAGKICYCCIIQVGKQLNSVTIFKSEKDAMWTIAFIDDIRNWADDVLF